MDDNLYSAKDGGLSLHQLLELLEENEVDTNVDIFTIPPEDGNETEQDSDNSDEEHEANLNHLGSNMLLTECIFQRAGNESVSDESNSDESDSDEYESSDNIPLSKYPRLDMPSTSKSNAPNTLLVSSGVTSKPIKAALLNLEWVKSKPRYQINSNCTPLPPSKEANNCKTPTDFFSLFFTESFCKFIVQETNKYAQRKNNPINLTINELYVFFGGLLLSGYAKYPNKRRYWSNLKDVPTVLSESMRLHRFESILKNFHLNDNDNIDRNDRLYKLRPMIEELNTNFRKHGGLEESLSIDESMIPYYGKHYAKQFIRGKPIRFGFKNWAICSSSGYMLNFEIYMGKKEQQDKVFGIGGDTVISLLEKAGVPSQKGFKIFFDNYFTSLNLMKCLADKGICATGTIQDGRTKNCPLSDKKVMMKKPKGTYDYRTSKDGSITLVRWKDNRVVTAATTHDTPEETTCVRWCRDKKRKVNVIQPQIFANYNKGMGGVDKTDQLVAVYRTRMRQRKWYWPIFAYLFDVSVVNGWLLMKKLNPNDERAANLLVFRRNIALSLLQSHGIPSIRGKTIPIPNDDIRFDGMNHWPEYNAKDKRCRYCKSKANFICTKCNVGLHPKICFKAFHTL